ncbi:MAG: hypothetical protein RL100_104 [Actinomycetota bacterium]
MTEQIRVGVIDADVDIRHGRRLMIDAQEDCKVVFEEENAYEAIERAPEALIDVLVVDHRVRGLDGIKLVEKIVPRYHELGTEVPAIILTGPYFSRELLLASIAAGAADLVTLDSDSAELLKAIRTSKAKDEALDFSSLKALIENSPEAKFDVPDILVKLGNLTDAEPAVLEAFKMGNDDDAIAAQLQIPKYRVRKSLTAILQKCGLATRAQLFLAVNYSDRKNG